MEAPSPLVSIPAGPLLSVAALHALVYCERLFYLEEVERIRVADAAVFAGRRLHVELAKDDSDGTWEKVTLESDALGICGTVDVLRRRDGMLVPYEHKRGRAAGKRGAYEAWDTDRIQVAAYTLLVEEALGQAIGEARVRYHATKATVRVPVDDVLLLVLRAEQWRHRGHRHRQRGGCHPAVQLAAAALQQVDRARHRGGEHGRDQAG